MFSPEELAIIEEAVRHFCAKECFKQKDGMLNPLEDLLPGKEKEYSQSNGYNKKDFKSGIWVC